MYITIRTKTVNDDKKKNFQEKIDYYVYIQGPLNTRKKIVQ